MRSVLTNAAFPTAWTQLQLINDNLDSVPEALGGLSLTYLYVLHPISALERALNSLLLAIL